MSRPILAAVAVPAAVAVLAAPGAATAEARPVVSQEAISPRTVAPLTIPGTGVKKGDRLPHGARLIFRTVTLEKGQRARLTLRAPARMTLRGLAPGEPSAIDFAVVRPTHYVGGRVVTVRAQPAPMAGAGKHTARIWALVR